MQIKKIDKINGGQDGAIYGSELFRFDEKGNCTVYDLKELGKSEPIAEFKLDRADEIAPHSNAVSFGCDFYVEGDEYPLLYTNIYNNYADKEKKLIGVCCVYRIQKSSNGFASSLVQLIEIGFCEDASLWKSYDDKHGVRPYGNFLADREERTYYAFVMKDRENVTRYFKFDLPNVNDGEYDCELKVRKYTLSSNEIKESFDVEYHRFIQGAAVYKGKIYSTEGFGDDKVNRPAIRIIDLETKKMQCIDIMDLGYTEEPEFIDFYDGRCLYSDAMGNLYEVLE